eukprot:5940553-Ditylum_brightwellii.AAC.1
MDDKPDFSYKDWGSTNLGGLMFHQYGVTTPTKQSYKEALLRASDGRSDLKGQVSKELMELVNKYYHGSDKQKGKWTTAANHLLRQLALRGKIDPNWVLLDSQST